MATARRERGIRLMWLVGALLLAPAAAPAPAQAAGPTHVLRLATVAPRGSAWAHEIDALVAEVAEATGGTVKIKVYYGGAAGSELQVSQRIAKGQLDGAISGGWQCRRVMPSMRVLGLVGVFQSRDEATYVLTQLRPTLEAEADKAGYVLLGTAGVGSVVIFSREPIGSMADLRRTKLWRWEGEEVELVHGKEMGLQAEPSSLEDAAKAYASKRVDGFYAVPMAALAFQWFAQTRYVTDLRTGYLQGCFLVTHKAFDALPPEHHKTLRAAVAKLILRFDAVSDQQEAALLGGVFEKQGLKVVQVNAKFRAEFFDSARDARERLGDKLVPRPLLDKVMAFLADYRAEHGR